MLEIIILAAGKGTRMRSDLPKVMHPLAGRPLLQHVVDSARQLSPSRLHIVVGHGADRVTSYFRQQADSSDLNFVEQAQQLGTGHAVAQALPHVNRDATVLVLYGDVPLISVATLAQLQPLARQDSLALLTVTLQNPQGYGRIVRDSLGTVLAIVEEKDATPEQKQLREVNTGILAVQAESLHQWLPRLSAQNAQGEYYLTDIVALARAENTRVETLTTADSVEVQGVNDRSQQAQLERHYQRRRAEQLLADGLTLLDPNRFDCRGELTHGADCSIDVNCVFEGRVVLGSRVRIGPNCSIKDVTIGDDTDILGHSVIEGAEVVGNAHIGPFARLRPGTRLHPGVRIGNFVEVKKSTVGVGSKINHLSYVGDAEVGADVNIGAGTITCNYDGANKYQTRIADGVFVGSNSALVAPVVLGENATVAAGSTVTQDVGPGQLAVARQRQRNIAGWQRPTKTEN